MKPPCYRLWADYVGDVGCRPQWVACYECRTTEAGVPRTTVGTLPDAYASHDQALKEGYAELVRLTRRRSGRAAPEDLPSIVIESCPSGFAPVASHRPRPAA